jgi:hypothetical protein
VFIKINVLNQFYARKQNQNPDNASGILALPDKPDKASGI